MNYNVSLCVLESWSTIHNIIKQIYCWENANVTVLREETRCVDDDVIITGAHPQGSSFHRMLNVISFER